MSSAHLCWVILHAMRRPSGLVSLAVLVLTSASACARDSDELSKSDAISRYLPLVLLFSVIPAVWVAVAAITHRREEAKKRVLNRYSGGSNYKHHVQVIGRATDPAGQSTSDLSEQLVMTEWHRNPITPQQAEILDAEMGARAEHEWKASGKATKSRNAAVRGQKDAELAEAYEALDITRFIRNYERLTRLLPEQNPPLPVGERDRRLAQFSRTTSGEIWRLRRLRNAIAHDDPYSIRDVRTGTKRIDVLLQNAANRDRNDQQGPSSS